MLIYVPLLFKTTHIFLAIWFVSGLIGRWVALHEAACCREIITTYSLVQIAGVFERWMVIPGAAAVLLLGILTGIAEGWPVLGFIQGGRAQWLLVSLLLFMSITVLVYTVFLPKGKIFERALQEALSQGQVTNRLNAAFRDRAVRAAHLYELAAVAAIIFLMITKPF